MRKSITFAACLIWVFISMPFLAGAGEKEEPISLQDLPEAVVKTIERAFPKAKLQRAVKEFENKELVYEVKIVLRDREYEVEFNADGEILEIEREDRDEEYIDVKELPKPVRKAVKKKFPKGKVVEAEKEVEHGKLVYEVELRLNGKEVEVEVTPEGKIVRVEEEDDDDDDHGKAGKHDDDDDHRKAKKHDDDDDKHRRARKGDDDDHRTVKDLPDSVKKAVTKAFPGARISEVEKEREHGQMVYEVEILSDGKEYEVEVTPDGKILEIEEEDD